MPGVPQDLQASLPSQASSPVSQLGGGDSSGDWILDGWTCTGILMAKGSSSSKLPGGGGLDWAVTAACPCPFGAAHGVGGSTSIRLGSGCVVSRATWLNLLQEPTILSSTPLSLSNSSAKAPSSPPLNLPNPRGAERCLTATNGTRRPFACGAGGEYGCADVVGAGLARRVANGSNAAAWGGGATAPSESVEIAGRARSPTW